MGADTLVERVFWLLEVHRHRGGGPAATADPGSAAFSIPAPCSRVAVPSLSRRVLRQGLAHRRAEGRSQEPRKGGPADVAAPLESGALLACLCAVVLCDLGLRCACQPGSVTSGLRARARPLHYPGRRWTQPGACCTCMMRVLSTETSSRPTCWWTARGGSRCARAARLLRWLALFEVLLSMCCPHAGALTVPRHV